MISRVARVNLLGGLLCAVGSADSLINFSSLHFLTELRSERRGPNFSLEHGTVVLQKKARTEIDSTTNPDST